MRDRNPEYTRPRKPVTALVAALSDSPMPRARGSRVLELKTRLNPAALSNILDLALVHQGAGRHDDALKLLAAAQSPDETDPRPFLYAAISWLAIGENMSALHAASAACFRGPQLPQAHYAYGQAWLARNEAVRAERAFADAIRLNPNWADAWVNYGIARYRQGAIHDAKTAMREALMRAPGHATAASNLGAFMRISGEQAASEDLLRTTIASEPHNSGARLNLAADLLQDERPEDALALLGETAPPADDLHVARHWHLQTSMALLQLGRSAEAKAALHALASLGPLPPELAPLWHWRQVLLAEAEKNTPRACAAATEMEASLGTMGPNSVLEHRIIAYYDLAKFWLGQDQRSHAFGQWVAGHALLRSIQPFSRDAAKAFTDAAIATFTAGHFAAGPRARNDDPVPVFIVGMPRSGTTLCEQIIAAHAQAHGAGELSALAQLFHGFAGGETMEGVARIAALPQATLDAAAADYLARLHALAPDKKRIVDKMPGNYRYVWLIPLLFPRAKIIHCTRDPRDIGLSIFSFRFHGDHGYAHDLGDLGWTIGEQDRLMAHAKAALPTPILTIKLSDWVNDFDGTLARVLSHLDLPPDANCALFYEADSRVRTVSRKQVREPVNARGLGRWKPFANELSPLIDELERAGSLDGWRDADHPPAGTSTTPRGFEHHTNSEQIADHAVITASRNFK